MITGLLARPSVAAVITTIIFIFIFWIFGGNRNGAIRSGLILGFVTYFVLRVFKYYVLAEANSGVPQSMSGGSSTGGATAPTINIYATQPPQIMTGGEQKKEDIVSKMIGMGVRRAPLPPVNEERSLKDGGVIKLRGIDTD